MAPATAAAWTGPAPGPMMTKSQVSLQHCSSIRDPLRDYAIQVKCGSLCVWTGRKLPSMLHEVSLSPGVYGTQEVQDRDTEKLPKSQQKASSKAAAPKPQVCLIFVFSGTEDSAWCILTSAPGPSCCKQCSCSLSVSHQQGQPLSCHLSLTLVLSGERLVHVRPPGKKEIRFVQHNVLSI